MRSLNSPMTLTKSWHSLTLKAYFFFFFTSSTRVSGSLFPSSPVTWEPCVVWGFMWVHGRKRFALRMNSVFFFQPLAGKSAVDKLNACKLLAKDFFIFIQFTPSRSISTYQSLLSETPQADKCQSNSQSHSILVFQVPRNQVLQRF